VATTFIHAFIFHFPVPRIRTINYDYDNDNDYNEQCRGSRRHDTLLDA